MKKTMTITLSYPHYDNTLIDVLARNNAPRVYRVEAITDSTDFVPHQQLPKQLVDQLCASNLWKVKMVPVS